LVEKSHTAGHTMGDWYPSILGPLHGIKDHIADFFAPAADAGHTNEHYDINIELPGVAVEDINIDIHDNTLTVRGEKKSERKEEGKNYFFSERTFGAFERSFRLPPDVETGSITANFKDGVLSIKMPKAGPPPEEKKRIKIQTT